MMTRLYLTRHGETEWNIQRRMQGRMDSPLTTLGEAQARRLGKRLGDTPIDIIITSSSGRAVRTADLIRGERLIPIRTNDHLCEIDLGEWEGCLDTEIQTKHPEAHRNFWYYPHLYRPTGGGETFAEVRERVSREIERIANQYAGQAVLIVTHAVVLKSLLAYFDHSELKDLWNGPFMKATSLSIVEWDGDERRVVLRGDIAHYDEKFAG